MGQVSSREKPPKKSQESPVPTHDGNNSPTPSGNGHQQTNLPPDGADSIVLDANQTRPIALSTDDAVHSSRHSGSSMDLGEDTDGHPQKSRDSQESSDHEKGSGGQDELADGGPTPYPNWIQLIMDSTKLVTDCSTLKFLGLLVYEFLRFWLFYEPTLAQARSMKFAAWIIPIALVPAGILGLYFGIVEKGNAKPSLIAILSSCFGIFALCFAIRLFVVRVFAKKHKTATRRVNYGLSFFNLFPLFILVFTVVSLCFDNEMSKKCRVHLLKNPTYKPG